MKESLCRSRQHPQEEIIFKEQAFINATSENKAVFGTLAVTIDEDKETKNEQSSIDKDKATTNKHFPISIESETSSGRTLSVNKEFPVDVDIDSSFTRDGPIINGHEHHNGPPQSKLHIGSDPYGLEDEEYPFIFDGDEFRAVFINKGYHLPSPTMDELEDITEPSEGQFAFVPPQNDLDEAPVRARSV